jgi:paraquat-inducible protein A
MEIIACPDCDLLQRVPELPSGGKARCPRCAHPVAGRMAEPIDLPLALTITAAIVFIIANTSPLMSLSAVGRFASTTIMGGARDMWLQGEQITGVVVAFCAVIAPAGYLAFMLTMLIAARRPPAPKWIGEMLRGAEFMEPWSMNEVMLLGILVALIKIAELAQVEIGVGMYAIGALVILFPAIMASFDPEEIWRRVQWADGRDEGRGSSDE